MKQDILSLLNQLATDLQSGKTIPLSIPAYTYTRSTLIQNGAKDDAASALAYAIGVLSKMTNISAQTLLQKVDSRSLQFDPDFLELASLINQQKMMFYKPFDVHMSFIPGLASYAPVPPAIVIDTCIVNAINVNDIDSCTLN